MLVVIDGMENEEYKLCKHIGAFSYQGEKNYTPQGKDVDSLNCIMNMLSVPVEKIPQGRAYLEALAMGVEVGEYDLVFRCNVVEIDKKNGILIGTCSNAVIDKEALAQQDKYSLVHITKHKYLLIIKDACSFYDSVKTYPPHQYIGSKIEDIKPIADGMVGEILDFLLEEYNISAWGQAVKEQVPSFKDIHKKKGAVVCKTEIVKGIAKAMDMYCPKIEGATGDIDTNLDNKLAVALSLTKQYPFVLLHINGTDESAHRKDVSQKHDMIQRVDDIILKELALCDDLDIMVSADHETSVKTGQHLYSGVRCYRKNQNKKTRE